MDFVSVETVVQVVKAHGSDARVEGDLLMVFPQGQTSPRVYRIPATGLGRRLIIEIGKKCGIQSHLFWHSSQVNLQPIQS
jgi:hypothetical protein